MKTRISPILGALALVAGVVSCDGRAVAEPQAASTALPKVSVTGPESKQDLVAQVVYARGYGPGFEYWGWSEGDTSEGRPARLDFGSSGGWQLGSHKSIDPFSVLRFRVRSELPLERFLEVAVRNNSNGITASVTLQKKHLEPLGEGWQRVTIDASELNPEAALINMVRLRAGRPVPKAWIEIDDMVLLRPVAGAAQQTKPVAASRTASLTIDCGGPSHRIHPEVFGIAYNARKAASDTFVWQLEPAARRWGGNPTSRYNYELGNAWNTGLDWYFTNVNFTDSPTYSWRDFLDENARHGVRTALTIPIMGFVAKNTTSYSFPVSVYGKQEAVDPWKSDAGNGNSPNGKPLPPGSPSRTSVAQTPQKAGQWVKAIRAWGQQRGIERPVDMYILDNEPMLWNSTHRDVHPEPTTYDELLEKTIAYASAIRTADPNAVIAGPAVWGWPAYFFSAKDAEAGFMLKPDRRAHGDKPFLEWYLAALRDHERKTGIKLLDVLDVHFYPQGANVYANGGEFTDRATSTLRVRSTRGLWDPTYKDESWIDETIMLLPRMKKIIDDNYPGLGLSIGEYSFGADTHISGGIALAEALGRFTQSETLVSAYYWTYPPAGSPAFQAFSAFRNYDGKGGRFLDWSLSTKGAPGVSLFASRDQSGGRIVAVLVNTTADETVEVRLGSKNCGALATAAQYGYHQKVAQLTALHSPAPTAATSETRIVLAPYSITVVELVRSTP